MSSDADFPHHAPSRRVGGARHIGASLQQRLTRLRDRAEIAAHDGRKLVRERAAIAASTGRAQVERAQSFVFHQVRERPLLTTGLVASAGVLLGLVLRSRRRSA